MVSPELLKVPVPFSEGRLPENSSSRGIYRGFFYVVAMPVMRMPAPSTL